MCSINKTITISYFHEQIFVIVFCVFMVCGMCSVVADSIDKSKCAILSANKVWFIVIDFQNIIAFHVKLFFELLLTETFFLLCGCLCIAADFGKDLSQQCFQVSQYSGRKIL